jgi:hypothetical protein
VDKLVKKRK